MSRDLIFYQSVCKALEPLSEEIAKSVAELNVKSFLENLLMQAQLAGPDGKTVHVLAHPKGNLEIELNSLTRKNYQNLTFQELKEKDAEMFYKIISDLWYIKDSEKVRKIMVF